MTIRITTLTENTAGEDLANLNWDFLAEYGLSILVEVEGLKILFDTGFSISAAHNAHILGINLSLVDKIVLSHGHNDHTGGLRKILEETGKVEVIAHPDIWDTKYACVEGKERFAGIPFRQEELESLGASFSLTREPVWITDNIVTTGEVPMTTDYEKVAPSLFVKEGDAIMGLAEYTIHRKEETLTFFSPPFAIIGTDEETVFPEESNTYFTASTVFSVSHTVSLLIPSILATYLVRSFSFRIPLMTCSMYSSSGVRRGLSDFPTDSVSDGKRYRAPCPLPPFAK